MFMFLTVFLLYSMLKVCKQTKWSEKEPSVRFGHESHFFLLILRSPQRVQEINIDPMNMKQNPTMTGNRSPGTQGGSSSFIQYIELLACF